MKKLIVLVVLTLAVAALFTGCNNAVKEDAVVTTSSQDFTQQTESAASDNTNVTETIQDKPEYTEENELEIMTIPPDTDAQEPTVSKTEPDVSQKETENKYEKETVIELPIIPVP